MAGEAGSVLAWSGELSTADMELVEEGDSMDSFPWLDISAFTGSSSSSSSSSSLSDPCVVSSCEADAVSIFTSSSTSSSCFFFDIPHFKGSVLGVLGTFPTLGSFLRRWSWVGGRRSGGWLE